MRAGVSYGQDRKYQGVDVVVIGRTEDKFRSKGVLGGEGGGGGRNNTTGSVKGTQSKKKLESITTVMTQAPRSPGASARTYGADFNKIQRRGGL